MLLHQLVIALVIIQIKSYNIDVNFAIIYTDPYNYLSIKTNKSSYFGQSLVLYPKSPAWLLVGAPRGNSPRVDFANPGVVFKCNIWQKCTMMDVDTEPKRVSTAFGSYINKLDDAWIGGTMDINYKYDRVVTCGYRWIDFKQSGNVRNNDYRMLGACYWFHVNDTTAQKLLPLLDSNRAIYSGENSRGPVYYYAQGQTGFSAHMPINERELLLGAPGVFNWDGTSILYRDIDDVPPIASKLRRTRRQLTIPQEFASANVANTILTTQTVAFDLFGYASTSGYFYNRTKLWYVSSAPRSRKYFGQVLIYAFSKNFDKALQVHESRQGTQLGEYFGASLTTGDINGDTYDDLIIGAPSYSAKKYNEGRIYVFLGSKKGRLEVPNQGAKITGAHANGQFGTTVQYMGDLNHDGFGDIAVSAPYENDQTGVVYIFRGTKMGLDVVPSQRIVARDISPNLRGFGVSISRPADIDDNKYPDVAIGAPLSGHAVILRTRPSVRIFHSLESFSLRLDYSNKSFDINACFWFLPDKISYDINITRTIVVDEQLGRAILQKGNYVETVHLTPLSRECQILTVQLKRDITNRYDPITVTLSHKLVSEEKPKNIVYIPEQTSENMFCLRCPVYNKYDSTPPTTVEIPFALGCGHDNVCSSVLELLPKFVGIGADYTFVLGSMDYLELETTVRNSGERAFLTQITVVLPEIINFRQIPSFCMEVNSSSVSCSVENPLESNSEKAVSLELDMSNVNSGKYEDSFVVTVMVSTSSENRNDNVKNLLVKLKREADVTISGKSGEQIYSYGNITEGKPNFTQIFQVEKFGISPIEEVLIELNIPHAIEGSNGRIDFITLHAPSGNLAGQPIICNSNFKYILEQIKAENFVDETGEKLASNESSNVKLLRRSVRQVQVFNESELVKEEVNEVSQFDKLQNRTFYVNCSTSGVICSKVSCVAGPFRSRQIAAIEIRMRADITSIKKLVGKRDVISFATAASVTVKSPARFIQSGDRPDGVQVVTIFVGDSIEGKVETWIIVLAVICGLLLLLLLIMGLIKAGFFKRAKKEELEELKKKLDMEENESDPLDDEPKTNQE